MAEITPGESVREEGETGRTILVGGTRAEAEAKCAEIGVDPKAPTTLIIPVPEQAGAARGLQVGPHDRVLWHESTPPRLAAEVRAAIRKGFQDGRGRWHG